MTLPDGITTCAVSVGPLDDFAGDTYVLKATWQPVLDGKPEAGNVGSIVWAATGTPLASFPEKLVSADGGEVTFDLPHVDQPGFIDGTGGEVTGWCYRVSVSAMDVDRKTYRKTKVFQVVQGQDTVDFDVIVDGKAMVPVTAPLPTVTSVNGQTGAVTVDPGEASDLSVSTQIDDGPLSGAAVDARVDAGLATLAPVASSGSAADLTSGILDPARLPALAITSVTVVGSQAAMLALDVQQGDVAIRSDFTPNKAFILAGSPATTLANWKDITATDLVQSVAGQNGNISAAALATALDAALAAMFSNGSAIDVAVAAKIAAALAAGDYVTAAALVTALAAKLDKAANLSDLANPGTARTNLGLGTVAVLASDTDGTLAANSDTRVPTQKAVVSYVASQVVGLLDYRGTYNASTNLFPATGGSGAAGALLKGDFYICSVQGTLGGQVVRVGDLIIALTDAPGQTAGNWDLIEHDLGYAPEDVANKSTDATMAANSDTLYPSQKAVKTLVATQIPKSLVDAKGDILVATADDTPARLAVGSNGQVLIADSTKTAGLRYADAPRGGPRKMTSGLYYGPGVHSPSTASYSLNIPNAVSIVIPHDITADRISCEVTTAVATSVVRLGIYPNEPATDSPNLTALILDAGTVDSSTTGGKEITISQALPAGTYWLTATPQVASGVALRSVGGLSDPLIGQPSNTTAASQGVSCFQLNTTTGALPGTAPSIIGRSVSGAKILLRVA